MTGDAYLLYLQAADTHISPVSGSCCAAVVCSCPYSQPTPIATPTPLSPPIITHTPRSPHLIATRMLSLPNNDPTRTPHPCPLSPPPQFDLTTGEPQPRLRGRAPHHSLALVNEPPPGMTYNCVFAETTDGRVAGVATRDIRAGEELFTYYGAEEREYSVAELDDYTAAAMDLRSEWLLDFEGRRLVPIAGCRGRVGEGEGVGEGESETGSGV